MLKKIAELINEKDNFVIIPHKNMDGDCLGSATALLFALRDMGKTAYIATEEEPTERLSFLWDSGYLMPDDFDFKVCICVDVAATYMIGDLYDKVFQKSEKTICIDHHKTNAGFADINFIKDASSAGEIVFSLLKEHLKCTMTNKICTALYSAIASDTGCFKYSNTTGQTHIIASYLVDSGIDASEIIRVLFETKKLCSLKLSNEIVDNMEFYFDNKVCITYVDENMLNKYNMTFPMTDDYATLPRCVEGVEVGVFFKVKGENEVKASLRSNTYADVALIAKKLGGGGHMRASGVTINTNLQEAKKMILDEIEKVI